MKRETSIKAAAPSEDRVAAGEGGSDTDNSRPCDAGIARPQRTCRYPHDHGILCRLGSRNCNLRGGDLGEGGHYDRIGARRVRLGRTEERQMRTDCIKHGRRHGEDATEFIDRFEGCARRRVIEARRSIIGELRILRPGGGRGSHPFANRRRQAPRAFGVAPGRTQ